MTKIQVNSQGKVYISNNKALIAQEGQQINNQDKTITENGQYTADTGYTGLGTVTVNVSGGGSSGEFLVRVIDYDGTVLKEDHLDTGDTFALPTPPSHSNLVFQSWSSPVDITNNTVTVTNSDIIIGVTYTTVSGLSEFDITLTKLTGLSVTLNMDGTKNWGDGTSDTSTTHTYSNYGNYTITCNGTTMTTSGSSGLFGQSASSINYYATNVRFANITSIGGSTFSNCCSLTNITIPEGVTSISSSAFSNCFSLTNITIPESVTSIGYYAFEGCCSLTNITIPEGVTSIGSTAFSNCFSLTNITIPESVTSIGYYAFEGCYSLTNITIPEGVTSIGENAFYYCYSLTSITIPESVTSIGYYAFEGCCSLTNITIPEGVTSIGSFAFYQCWSIIEYDFSNHTSIPTLSSTNAFNGINQICKIYVPWDLYNAWKTATNWSTYADYISHSNPATVSFSVTPANSIIYVNDLQISGTSTSWVGSSMPYVIYNSSSNTVLSKSYMGITEGATINITEDLSNPNKITLSTGVSGLLVKASFGNLEFSMIEETSGNYVLNVVGSGVEFNYAIEGGANYMDLTGTITTTGSDMTEVIILTPAVTTSWTRPDLTANGILGGNEFAVADLKYTNTNPYRAVDNSTSTYWGYYNSGDQIFVFYNPDVLNVTSIEYTLYSSGSSSYRPKAITIQGSNDNIKWEDIESTYAQGSSASKYISTLTNTKYYKYYKLTCTPYSAYVWICDMAITATYKVPVS